MSGIFSLSDQTITWDVLKDATNQPFVAGLIVKALRPSDGDVSTGLPNGAEHTLKGIGLDVIIRIEEVEIVTARFVHAVIASNPRELIGLLD